MLLPQELPATVDFAKVIIEKIINTISTPINNIVNAQDVNIGIDFGIPFESPQLTYSSAVLNSSKLSTLKIINPTTKK